MIFKKINLLNFRNFKQAEFKFNNVINVFFGQNAQGKTNLLESLWLFTGAKSFRNSKDHELINFDNEKASIYLNFYDNDRDQTAVINIEKSMVWAATEMSTTFLVR